MDSHLEWEHLSRLWGRSKSQRRPPLAWALKLWYGFIWYSRSVTVCSPFPWPKTDWDQINWPYKTPAACVAYQVDYELCYLKTLWNQRVDDQLTSGLCAVLTNRWIETEKIGCDSEMTICLFWGASRRSALMIWCTLLFPKMFTVHQHWDMRAKARGCWVKGQGSKARRVITRCLIGGLPQLHGLVYLNTRTHTHIKETSTGLTKSVCRKKQQHLTVFINRQRYKIL